MNERQAFLDRIKEDPYDLITRKIYADWLDEFGSDSDADLATEQRAWTREKQDAIEWLTGFAADVHDTDFEDIDDEIGKAGPGMSYDSLIEAAHAYLDHDEYHHLDYNTPGRVYKDREEFWRKFRVATGRQVATDKQGMFFSCAC